MFNVNRVVHMISFSLTFPQSKNFSNFCRAASVVEAFGYTGPCQKAYLCEEEYTLLIKQYHSEEGPAQKAYLCKGVKRNES